MKVQFGVLFMYNAVSLLKIYNIHNIATCNAFCYIVFLHMISLLCGIVNNETCVGKCGCYYYIHNNYCM